MGSTRVDQLLSRRHDCLAGAEAIPGAMPKVLVCSEPLDGSDRAKQGDRPAATQAGSQVGLGKAEEIPVELHDQRHIASDPTAEVLDRAGRLAVNDVVGALGMEANELGVRLAQPDRVVLMPGRVDEEVPGSVHSLLPLAFRMPRGDHVHLVAGSHESSREVARVILHAPDAMLRDDEGDDADPHWSTRTRSRPSGETAKCEGSMSLATRATRKVGVSRVDQPARRICCAARIDAPCAA